MFRGHGSFECKTAILSTMIGTVEFEKKSKEKEQQRWNKKS